MTLVERRRPVAGVPLLLGTGGLLLALALGLAAWGFLYDPPGRSVLLITLDMVRPDHLGAYGYPRDTSPTLDALAADGLLFEDAYMTAVLSAPSHASVMTALPPGEHGLVDNIHVLPPEAVTVAEVARAAGVRTAAFVSEPLVGPEVGLDQGFQELQVLKNKNHLHQQQSEAYALRTYRAAADWIREHTSSGSFFAWVHAQNAHFDWFPPEEARQRFVPPELRDLDVTAFDCVREQNAWFRAPENEGRPLPAGWAEVMTARYDAEISVIDRGVAEILDALEATGARDRTTVIVLSDHGATLFDRREIDHTDVFFEETLRTVLMVHDPDPRSPRGRVRGFVELTQVAPTIAEALGVRWNQQRAPADSLYEVGRRGQGRTPFPRRTWHYGRSRGCVREGPWKLTQHNDQIVLYDLEHDPEERINVATEHPLEVRSLRKHLRRATGRLRPSNGIIKEKNSEVLQMLREGGYLDEVHQWGK